MDTSISTTDIFSDVDLKDLEFNAKRQAISVQGQTAKGSSVFSSAQPKQVSSEPTTPQSTDTSHPAKSVTEQSAPALKPNLSELPSLSDVLEGSKESSDSSEADMYKRLYEESKQTINELKATNEALKTQLKSKDLKIEFMEKQLKQNQTAQTQNTVLDSKPKRRMSQAERIDASVKKIQEDEEIGALAAAVGDVSNRVTKLEQRDKAYFSTTPKPPASSKPKAPSDAPKVQHAKITTTTLAEDLVTSAIAKKNKWVANKDSFTADGFTFGYVDNELYVIKANMRTNKLMIPAFVDNIPVKGILGGAMSTSISDAMKSITGTKLKLDYVYLPKTITHIDRGAFKGVTCSKLIIPASVSYIAKDAFDGLTCDVLWFACDQSLITGAIAGATIKVCEKVEEVVS